MRDTKEKILLTALTLFATDGYEAVSVSDIARELGITKGALYRHYGSKRDIFESILRRMEQRDAEMAGDHELPEETREEAEEAYLNASVDDIIDFSKAMFRYWTQDEFASLFRRVLTIEQYRDTGMSALYQQYLGAGPVGYTEDLFSALGVSDPWEAAARLYAPMHLLYGMYDAAEDKTEILALSDSLLERERAWLKGEGK